MSSGNDKNVAENDFDPEQKRCEETSAEPGHDQIHHSPSPRREGSPEFTESTEKKESVGSPVPLPDNPVDILTTEPSDDFHKTLAEFLKNNGESESTPDQPGNEPPTEDVKATIRKVDIEYPSFTKPLTPTTNVIGRRELENPSQALHDTVKLPPIPTAVIVPNDPSEKLTGIRRFKRIARMVKTNLAWAKDVREHYEEENAFVVKGDGSESESLVFNVANFKVVHNSYGGISPRMKVILTKHPDLRTASEISQLTDVVRRLKCFDKYSSAAKHELARIIFYESFEEGRVVIQEGHIGFSFYFIATGTVNVRVTEVDKSTGEKHTLRLGELSEGASFGELALLHNIRRTATIVCKTDCEFLRVDKTDFETVLRSVTNAEYEKRLCIMKEFPAFTDWTIEEIQDANYATRIKEYPPNQILSGKHLDSADNFYIVITGECYLVREIYVLKHHIPYGGYKLRLPTEKQLAYIHQMNKVERGDRKRPNRRRQSVISVIPQRRLWNFGILGRFSYFGVGEELKDTYIVSKTRVDLLMVPKLLFSKLGRSRSLDTMKKYLEASVPDNQRLFREYHVDFQWRTYKSDLVNEIINQRKVKTNTELTDVPSFIRQDSNQERY